MNINTIIFVVIYSLLATYLFATILKLFTKKINYIPTAIFFIIYLGIFYFAEIKLPSNHTFYPIIDKILMITSYLGGFTLLIRASTKLDKRRKISDAKVEEVKREQEEKNKFQ